jgi:hypothetical protein
MADDLEKRARDLEQALDWEGAESAWERAAQAGCPGAEEGLARVRRGRAVIAGLRRVTHEMLDHGDLFGAVMSLREIAALVHPNDPELRALRRRWFAVRHRLWRRNYWVGAFAVAAVTIPACLTYLVLHPKLGFAAFIPGGAIGAILLEVCRRCSPALRPRRLPPLHVVPEDRDRGGRGEAPIPRPWDSRVERWRRDAKAEAERGWEGWSPK